MKTFDKVKNPIVGNRYHVCWSKQKNVTFTLHSIIGSKVVLVSNRSKFECNIGDLRHSRRSTKK